MKIETKFNIGDKVYYTENGEILELEIIKITVVSTEKDSYFVEYKGENRIGNLYFPLENELFETKEEAFQDLVENLKIKYDIK